MTLPDGKKDGKGLLAVTSNAAALASLFQVNRTDTMILTKGSSWCKKYYDTTKGSSCKTL